VVREYDGHGQLVGIREGLGRKTSIAYNVAGLPVLVDAAERSGAAATARSGNHFRSRADILGRKTAPDGVIGKVIGILPQSFVIPMEVRSDIHSGQGNASLFLLLDFATTTAE
jgi:YD repeat-containing protein